MSAPTPRDPAVTCQHCGHPKDSAPISFVLTFGANEYPMTCRHGKDLPPSETPNADR